MLQAVNRSEVPSCAEQSAMLRHILAFTNSQYQALQANITGDSSKLSPFQMYLLNLSGMERVTRGDALHAFLRNFETSNGTGLAQHWSQADVGALPIAEIVTLSHDFVIARTEHGVCFAYNCLTHETMLVNKNANETVRSTFQNTVNNSIFIISVKNRGNLWRMKCRAVSLDDLRAGRTKGTRLFKKFVLQYPDFVEVDDLNRKVVTKHTEERCFRVWDLGSYEMLYVLRHDFLFEFKICHGVMLLIFEYI